MKTDKTYLADTHLAGRLYHMVDDVWESPRVGTKLLLVREPDNAHDPSAVAVHLPVNDGTVMLGYLPREANELPAILIDMGWGHALECTVARLDPSAPYDSQVSLVLKILRNPAGVTVDGN